MRCAYLALKVYKNILDGGFAGSNMRRLGFALRVHAGRLAEEIAAKERQKV
jgi:hypothetical protein